MSRLPLRVVHVIDELPPHGAERLLADILKHRGTAFQYTVLCLARGGALVGEIERCGVPVSVLGKRRRFDFKFFIELIRWMRAHRPAVVHTHLFTADSWGRLAAYLTGVPVIVATIHSDNRWKGPTERFVDKCLAKLSTRVIACSEDIGRGLIRGGIVSHERLVVIPNGIDLARLRTDLPAEVVRAEWNIDRDLPVVGIVGRLHPAKGHEDLLIALARLKRNGTRVACLVIGDGELRGRLERKVSEFGLADTVIFAGFRTDVAQLLAMVDIVAMPSHWEGLPMTLLESMALGKAIVASSVGGIPDVIRDGENGVLIDPEAPGQLCAALERLAKDPGRRLMLGTKARSTVMTRYRISDTAAAYERLYVRTLLKYAGVKPNRSEGKELARSASER